MPKKTCDFYLNITGNIRTCFCNWSQAMASTCDHCRIFGLSTICRMILEPYLCKVRHRCSLRMKIYCKQMRWNHMNYAGYSCIWIKWALPVTYWRIDRSCHPMCNLRHTSFSRDPRYRVNMLEPDDGHSWHLDRFHLGFKIIILIVKKFGYFN